MALQVGTLVVRIAGDLKGLTNALRRAEESIRATGRRIKNIGGQLTAGITLPLGFAAGAAITFAAKFEKSLTKINTLVGISQEQIGEWKDEILNLAPAVGAGPGELADAMFFITSAGQRGSQALQTLETSAKASAIGMGQVKTIADAIVSSMAAYGEENLDAARAADILTATVREGKLETTQLAGAIGRVLPVANQMGVSLEEVGGFIASFTRVGVDARQAATSLRGVLSALMQDTQKQREAFREAGMTLAEFRREVADEGLPQALVNLMDAVGDNDTALRDIIPRIRALVGALATARSQGQEFIDMTERIVETSGAVEEGFETVQETTAQTWDEFLAKVQVVAIELGDTLIPAFDGLLDVVVPILEAISSLIAVFTELPQWLQTTALAIATITIVIGPLLFLIGGIITAIASLVSLGFTLGSVFSVGGGVITGLTILAGIGLKFASNWGKARKEAIEYERTMRRISTMDLARVNRQMADALQEQQRIRDELDQELRDQAEDRIGTFSREFGSAMQNLKEQAEIIDRITEEGFTGEPTERQMELTAALARTNQQLAELENRLDSIKAEMGADPADDGDGSGVPGGLSQEEIEAQLKRFDLLERMGENVHLLRLRFINRELAAEEAFTDKWIFLKNQQLDHQEDFWDAQRARYEEMRQLQADWVQFRVRTGQISMRERIRQINTELETVEEGSRRALELEEERFNLITRETSEQIRDARRLAQENEAAAKRSLRAWRAELQARGELTPAVRADIERAMEDIDRAAMSKMRNLNDRLTEMGLQMGANLASSLARGVRDEGELVKNMIIRFLEQAILFAVKAELGIASPSKVAISWGESIGEGLAIGIESTASRVRKATGKMVAATSPMAPGMGRLRTAPVSGSVPRGGVNEANLLRMIRDRTRGDPVLAARQPELIRIVGEAYMEWRRGGGR